MAIIIRSWTSNPTPEDPETRKAAEKILEERKKQLIALGWKVEQSKKPDGTPDPFHLDMIHPAIKPHSWVTIETPMSELIRDLKKVRPWYVRFVRWLKRKGPIDFTFHVVTPPIDGEIDLKKLS